MLAGDTSMMDTLGQRILRAARLAVATHMQQVAVEAAGSSTNNNVRGQRVVIGRAGPQAGVGARPADRSRDGRLPTNEGEMAPTPQSMTAAAGPETEDDVSDSPSTFSSAEGAD